MRFFIFIILLSTDIYSANTNISRNDFWLTLKDGTKLECTSFIPDSELPDKRFPCIVYCHGFGQSKEDIIPSAESYAYNGYYTFTYSMRGQGFSSGQSNLISKIEMNDLFEVIDYLKSQEKIDKDKIAISGASQGGIIPFMACCNGLDVNCIIADLTSPEFASNWIDNGCIKMSLLWTLSYNEITVRYNNNVKKFRDWILSDKKDKWDSISRYLPEGRDFINKVSNNEVPSFFSNSWEDIFFSSNGIIKSSENFRNDFKIYLGAIPGHGSEYFSSEDNFHNQGIINWINYHLKDIDSQYDLTRYIFAYSTAPVINTSWIYYQYKTDISPFVNYTPLTLYFLRQGKLSENPNNNTVDSVIFENVITDTSLTIKEAVNLEFNTESFFRRFFKKEIYFDSELLDYNYNMLGIPKLHLVYSSNAKVCQFNFQIWEVCNDGITKFVSSINYTDRNNVPNSLVEKDIEGNAEGHIFSKGNKIRIILTNLDTRYGDFYLRSNPYVLPILKNARNLVYTGLSNSTYIRIPLKESD